MINLNIQLFGGRGADFALKKNKLAVNVDNTELLIPKGTEFTKVIVIAGDDRKRKVDSVNRLIDRYGGKQKNWSKRVAETTINGKKAEVHYYQNKKDNIGRVEFKIKRWKE